MSGLLHAVLVRPAMHVPSSLPSLPEVASVCVLLGRFGTFVS
ncbi:hypothetical protein CAP2UW1_1278 [Candidatus Accumulibacter phosphatis]|jgi:hypothetical protein|uniref:Uncharacterized protein n=1 Tax=Accumulibacter regalis TaxID=522306 RepID=C7RS92_ACCRE